MNTEDGNKIIAEFMGYDIIYGEKPYVPFYPPIGMSDEEYQGEVRKAEAELAHWEYYNRLQYHSSWDWLIPVVEKIEGLGYAVDIIYNDCEIEPVGAMVNQESKIKAVYKAVIEFIDWYNKVQNVQESDTTKMSE